MSSQAKKVALGLAATFVAGWVTWVSSSISNLNVNVAVLKFNALGVASVTKPQGKPVGSVKTPQLAQPTLPVWLWLPKEAPDARK